ncbi:MAG: alpha/beta hydrolase-fold protein [Polyangiales bacterium]
MTRTGLQRFELFDPVHGDVPCTSYVPNTTATGLPLCLFLYGGGGSAESLAEIAPLLEAAVDSGAMPACVLATPGVAPWSFYLDDPPRGYAWESFITERFIPHLQREHTPRNTGLIGISMGGYAALKLAFARPHVYGAVAAISPMLEPSVAAEPVPPRNRYFYPADVPAALLGTQRDPELYRRDHPASRVRTNLTALRASTLAIYIDSAGRDLLHAHDGAEYLHRQLWSLDVPHEYHLRRDADHVGPDLEARLLAGLGWALGHLQPTASAALTPLEQAWSRWLDEPENTPPPTPLPAKSSLLPHVLRAQLSPLRTQALQHDETISHHYGRL